MIVKLFVLIVVCSVCDGYKLLVVFPVPGKSHAILGEGYVRHLLEAGHEVTYITPLPIKNPPVGLRQVDVSENFKFFAGADIFNLKSMMYKEIELQDYEPMLSLFLGFMNATLQMDVVQKFINDPNEQFDAVVAEWLYTEMGSGFAAVFNCPLVWSSSMVPHTMVLALIDEHLNPAYAIHNLSKDYAMTFWKRVENLLAISWIRYYQWKFHPQMEKIFQDAFGAAILKRGRKVPSFDDVRYNASLMLGNSHICAGDSIALPQNYKDIGGYHIKNVTEPLPQNLQKIMDSAKHGVIYFSMGTMLQSHSMPEALRRKFLDTFSQFKQTVIWKLEKPMSNLPKNVHIVTWAPQASILVEEYGCRCNCDHMRLSIFMSQFGGHDFQYHLGNSLGDVAVVMGKAHPNCVLFISHGGLLSMLEALNFGVPIIGMPFYADQYLNTDRAVIKGFGRRLVLTDNSPEDIKPLLKEMLEPNSKYRRRAKELSAVFRDRLVPPGKELVYWIEHVIRSGGAPHMRSVALQVEWYKKLYLDLAAVILVTFIMFLAVLKYTARLASSSNKKKVA